MAFLTILFLGLEPRKSEGYIIFWLNDRRKKETGWLGNCVWNEEKIFRSFATNFCFNQILISGWIYRNVFSVFLYIVVYRKDLSEKNIHWWYNQNSSLKFVWRIYRHSSFSGYSSSNLNLRRFVNTMKDYSVCTARRSCCDNTCNFSGAVSA